MCPRHEFLEQGDDLGERRRGAARDVVRVEAMVALVERREHARDQIVDVEVIDAKVPSGGKVQRFARDGGVDQRLRNARPRQARTIYPTGAQVDALQAVQADVVACQLLDGEL